MEAIASAPLIFRITKENAREFAEKSWNARRAKAALREQEAEQGRKSTPQSERIAKQIERIEEMMDKTKDPDALSSLTMAHSRLFSSWQVLTGTPNPGSRKSRRSESQVSRPMIEPVAAPQASEPPQSAA